MFRFTPSTMLVRKQAMFYKICKNKCRQYHFKLIPKKPSSYATRNADNISLFIIKHDIFKKSFYSLTIIEWNKIDPTL